MDPRKIGRALIIPEEDGTFSVMWEVSVRGRPMFHQEGPGGISRDEAIGSRSELLRPRRGHELAVHVRSHGHCYEAFVVAGVGFEPTTSGL